MPVDCSQFILLWLARSEANLSSFTTKDQSFRIGLFLRLGIWEIGFDVYFSYSK